MQVFRRLLLNSLIYSATTMFLWFAVTFWVYLETRSVVATSIIAGAYSLASAALGLFFGTFVDRHRKKSVMVLATAISVAAIAVACAQYVLVGRDRLTEFSSPWFWLFVVLVLAGSVTGNLRAIALTTCVTLLVAENERDRANGLSGSVTGVSFMITSIFSGLAVGQLGMGWVLGISLGFTALAAVHLLPIDIPELEPQRVANDGQPKFLDVRGAIDAIGETPGLWALIAFASFNNLIGGVFMSLMDAYGLALMSVEVWGFIFAGTSFGFILGGMFVAKRGLGPKPMRVIIVGNVLNWVVCALFTARSSIVLVAIGLLMWLTLLPIVEAAEQTVLQRAVPFEKQGRVFGFAQTVENAVSPMTAFMIGPIAEAVFIPFMTTGRGVDWIGGWFGVGPERGIALIFTLAGLLGLVGTFLAWGSKSYRLLANLQPVEPSPAPPGVG